MEDDLLGRADLGRAAAGGGGAVGAGDSPGGGRGGSRAVGGLQNDQMRVYVESVNKTVTLPAVVVAAAAAWRPPAPPAWAERR